MFSIMTRPLSQKTLWTFFHDYPAEIWRAQGIPRTFPGCSRSQGRRTPLRTSMTRGSHSFRASHLQWILKLSSAVAMAEETVYVLAPRGSRDACTGTLAPIKINAFAAFLVTVPSAFARHLVSLPLLQPPSVFFFFVSFYTSSRERWSPMSLHRSNRARVAKKLASIHFLGEGWRCRWLLWSSVALKYFLWGCFLLRGWLNSRYYWGGVSFGLR